MSGKKKIFISHITEEREIAIALKLFLDEKFLGGFEIFVSSDSESIKLGDEWFNNIKKSLNESSILIILCSPYSIVRPWINFEAGAGWIKGIPVIPMCHSGLIPGNLPYPLKVLQGGVVNNEKDIDNILKRVAEIGSLRKPELNKTNFFNEIKVFETQVTSSGFYKDTQFIDDIIKNDIIDLKYCLFASATDISEQQIDIFNVDFKTIQYDFRKLYNSRESSIHEFHLGKKVYEILDSTLAKISGNLKFILSNSFYKISPELIQLFNQFLSSRHTNARSWANYFSLIKYPTGNFEEDRKILGRFFPPKYIKNDVLNNIYNDYLQVLLFLTQWINSYEMQIEEILKSVGSQSAVTK